jgi:hypothetical protein
MKIFNYIKGELSIPIIAENLQAAHESFFKTEGYTIEVDPIERENKDQFKLFDMDELEAEWKKVEGEEPI